MASRHSATLMVLTCAFGCATYTQDEPHLSSAAGGNDSASAGTSASTGAGDAGHAGESTTAGASSAGSGGGDSSSGGAFPFAGTFGTAGTLAVAGAGQAGASANGGANGSADGGKSNGGGGNATGGSAAGGSAGAGGKPATDGCAAHPIPAKATWTATASIEAGPCPGMPNPDYCGPAARAIDGELMPINMTRYTTGTARTGNEWLQIDFGAVVTLSELRLTTAPSNDYTQGYEVRLSAQAANIATAPIVVTGTGSPEVTTITFPSLTSGRFLRINQLASDGSWWSIQELDVSCK